MLGKEVVSLNSSAHGLRPCGMTEPPIYWLTFELVL